MPTNSLEPLYEKVAKKVLKETLKVRRGESVTVESWDDGLPFARRVVAEARAMGCTAVTIYEDERAYVEGVRRAPADSVGTMGKNEYGLLSGTDAYVFIPGQAIGANSRTLKREERERSIRYNSSWYDAAAKAGLRGARLSYGYVGRDLARALGKSVREVVSAQLRASLADYGQISYSAKKVSALLSDDCGELATGSSVLTFSLRGEIEVEDGVVDEHDLKTGSNMAYVPPGFVAKEVDPESANGSVALTDSLTEYGVIRRARLEFKGGLVVGWESTDDGKLKRLIEAIPPGRRRLGLLMIGLNPKMAYGLGQDRCVEGAVTLGGFGFRGQVKLGTLGVAGQKVVAGGRLVA